MGGLVCKSNGSRGIRILNGEHLMGRHRVLDHDRIIKLYQQDHTMREIANLVGANHSSVCDILKANDVPRRPRHRRETLDHQGIITAYQSGKSAEQVAKEFSCSKPGVFHILRKYNIETREGWKRQDLNNRLGFEPTAEWLQAQLDEHGTASEVARQNNISYGTLIERMDSLDVKREVWRGGPGGKTRRQDIPIEEAIKLSNQGHTYEKLADRYGVSYGVIANRMKEVGYHAPKDRMRKYPANSIFRLAPWHHKKLLNHIGIKACEICGETRALDFHHIVFKKDGGPTVEDNCLVLCPLHHRLVHSSSLNMEEAATISKKVNKARRKYGGN